MAYTVLLFVTLFVVKLAMVGAVYLFTPAIALIVIPLAYFAAVRMERQR